MKTLWIIRIGVLAALATPLIVTPFTIFPFVFGKGLWLTGIMLLLLPFWVWLLARDPAARPGFRHPIVITVIVHALVLVLAAAFGVDPLRSVLGDEERMSGLVTIFAALLIGAMAASVFRTREDWRVPLIGSLVVSALVFGTGVFQQMGVGLFAITGTGRFSGSFGNYIFFGTYFIFQTAFALHLFVTEKWHGWRWIWAGAAVLGALAIVLSGTRGAVLALALSVVVAPAYLLLSRQTPKQFRWGALAVLILLVGSTLLLYRFREHPAVASSRLGRIVHIRQSFGTATTRLMAWSVALQGVKDHPVLGYGPDNFQILFNQHYDPRFLRFSSYETWFDHPHNRFLEELATAGIFGLAAYLGIFAAAFWAAWRSRALVLALLLFAYMIQNFFAFDTPSSFMLFYFVLAFAYRWSKDQVGATLQVAQPQRLRGLKTRDYPVIGTGVVSLVALCVLVLHPLRAGTVSAAAIFNAVGNPQKLSAVADALRMKTVYPAQTRLVFAQMVVEMLESGVEVSHEMVEEAVRFLDQLVIRHPKQVYYQYLLARVLVASGESANLDRAEEVIERAMALSPRRQQLFFAKAWLARAREDQHGAVVAFREMVALDPEVPQSYWFLGVAEIENGELHGGAQHVLRAIRGGITTFSTGEINRIGRALLEANLLDDLQALYETLTKYAPDQVEYHLKLAAVYHIRGNDTAARASALHALELDPTLKSTVDAFLLELTTK